MKKIIISIVIGAFYCLSLHGQVASETLIIDSSVDPSFAHNIENSHVVNPFVNEVICDVTPRFSLWIDKNVVEERAFSITVVLEVTQINHGLSETNYLSLNINYDPINPYVDKVIEYIPESSNNKGGKVTYFVKSVIYNSGISGGDPHPKNVYLTSTIDADRHFSLSSYRPNIISNPILQRNELWVNWTDIYSTEIYQFEWYFVNDYAYDKNNGGASKSPNELRFNEQEFTQNSTRVETNKSSYSIPYLYEKGYLLYRVRALNTSCTGKINYSAWSYEFESPYKIESVASFPNNAKFPNDGNTSITGHDQNLNWTRTTNYVEQGKQKTVVAYYDGNMKNRQTVTKLNTSQTTIVGETIYDKEGRPAIEVLPVPTTQNSYSYHPNFNRSATSDKPYSAEDFDYFNEAKFGANAMSTDEGAAKYYSSNSDFQTEEQKYVPDAKGFPFMQKEYTKDNSGKIAKVHSYKMLDKNDQERMNRFYYMNPDEGELEQYFGNQVGDFSKYKKDYAIDANGQVTITYKDNKDRVIATALTGISPSGMTPIYDAANKVLIGPKDLLSIDNKNPHGKNNREIQQTGYDASKKFLLLEPGQYDFTYSVNPGTYTRTFPECDSISPICYDCVVSVEFELRDEDGDVVDLHQNDSLNSLIEQTVGNVDFNSCDNVKVQFDDFNTGNLEPGLYSISKKLVINEDSLDKYTANFLKNLNCEKSYEYFFDLAEAENDSALFACNDEVSCEECEVFFRFSESTIINDASNGINDETAYDAFYKNCKSVCDAEPKNCSGPYERMLKDMSPYGQYAQFEVIETGVSASSFSLSIFNYFNQLPEKTNLKNINLKRFNHDGAWKDYYAYAGDAHWRMPYSNGSFYYKNADKTRSIINLEYDEKIGYIPAVQEGVQIKTFDTTGQKYIYPHELKYRKDFISKWQDSWAKDLVYYHPEYKYYEFCIQENNYAGIIYDQKLKRAEEFEKAFEDGLLDKSSQWPNPVTSGKDPFFVLDGEATREAARDQMLEDITNYDTNNDENLSMYQMAALFVNCPDPILGSCPKAKNDCVFDESTINVQTDNDYWKKFRDLYITSKNNIYNQYQTKHAIVNESYNGCIGEENYSFYLDPNIRRRFWGLSFSPYYFSSSDNALCRFTNAKLYENKIKVFSSGLALEKAPSEEGESCETTDEDFQPAHCVNENLIAASVTDQIDFVKYEQCGQCPEVVDLQLLLSGLMNENSFITSDLGFNLTCPFASYFTPDLIENLKMFTALNIRSEKFPYHVQWKNIVTNDQGAGEIYMVNDDGVRIPIFTERFKFKILDPESGFNLSNIKSSCCFQHQADAKYYITTNSSKVFKFKAKISNGLSGDAEIIKEFSIEGTTSSLELDNCVFDKICSLNKPGKDLESFLNMLAMDYTGAPEAGLSDDLLNKKTELVSSSEVDISGDNTMYSTLLSTEFWEEIASEESADKTWSSSVSGDVLTGTLTAGTKTGQITLRKITDTNYSFADIVQFVGMRVDDSFDVGVENNFIITAIVRNSNGSTRPVFISGNSSEFTFGSCYTPQKNGGKVSAN